MKTQELLDKINNALKESFAPFIGIKNYSLGWSEHIVRATVEPLLPKEMQFKGLSSIGYNSNLPLFGKEMEQTNLWILNIKGFKPNRGSDEVGTWTKAPFYPKSIILGDTVEEFVRNGIKAQLAFHAFNLQGEIEAAKEEIAENQNIIKSLKEKEKQFLFEGEESPIEASLKALIAEANAHNN